MNDVSRRAVLALGAVACLGGCASRAQTKFKASGPPSKIQSLAVVYELGRTRFGMHEPGKQGAALVDQTFGELAWPIARMNGLDLKAVVFSGDLLNLPPLHATHLLHIRSTRATKQTNNATAWVMYELECSLYEGTRPNRKLLWESDVLSRDQGTAPLSRIREARFATYLLLNELLTAFHEEGFHTLPQGEMLDADGRPFTIWDHR